ncbi:MAG: hypothetical protein AAGU76_05830 [Sedimentibacter sp.]|uniref:hypothetical protein n=1 Tax=Sedimentibacter sp. TaxID=1960295 RepID=UPI00315872CF
MKELFLNTDEGLVPIEEQIVEKYGLKAGTKSPFHRFWIVDKNGKKGENKGFGTSSPDADEMPEGEGLEDDEIVEFEETGAIMSQSEIIDFSRGTDSDL